MQELKTIDDWAACREASKESLRFVFKHSTACPISAAAYRRLTDYLDRPNADPPPFFIVKVIESRPVSNAIAKDTALRHQSPQLILLDGGAAAWSASHGGITARAVEEALGTTSKRADGE